MAHWHDSNPWAAELIYLPSLEEAAACCTGGTITDLETGESMPYDEAYLVDHWLEQSRRYGTPGKLDAYLLRDGPLSRGPRKMHLGVRWGDKPEEYFSPHVANPGIALILYHRYGGK